MLEIKNLSYGYSRRKEVLHDISFALKPGITLLVGENGSGKSTIMKLLTGAIPTKTPILIDGRELTELERKRRMAYLPQEMEVFPALKVRDLLRFVAEAKGVAKADVARCVEDAARQVNVEQFLDTKVKRCSVGTRQRVGIATTLLGEPEIVILDEPTAGVDPKERSRFYHTIRECYADKTVLISTHILDDVQILADYVLMLSAGKIVFDGTFSEFVHALDGRVYQGSAQAYAACAPEEKHTMPVLSEVKNVDGAAYHVCADVPPAAPGWTAVTPTLEDIWEYYQRGAAHE